MHAGLPSVDRVTLLLPLARRFKSVHLLNWRFYSCRQFSFERFQVTIKWHCHICKMDDCKQLIINIVGLPLIVKLWTHFGLGSYWNFALGGVVDVVCVADALWRHPRVYGASRCLHLTPVFLGFLFVANRHNFQPVYKNEGIMFFIHSSVHLFVQWTAIQR